MEKKPDLERAWVEDLIFDTKQMRRYLQDSPVLPDVWLGYAKDLNGQRDLLLTPFVGVSPGELSRIVQDRLKTERESTRWQTRHGNVSGSKASARLAYNQANVVLRLWFDELIRVVLPLSSWYWEVAGTPPLQPLAGRPDLGNVFQNPQGTEDVKPGYVWLIRLIGSFELAREKKPDTQEAWDNILKDFQGMVQAAAALMPDAIPPAGTDKGPLWTVSNNRPLKPSIALSVPAIKADAANQLFRISCKDVSWAIIDTGIDATHEAFFRRKPDTDGVQKKRARSGGTEPGSWPPMISRWCAVC